MQLREKVVVVSGGGSGIGIATHSGLDMAAETESDEGSGYRTTSPDDAARIILDGIEDDRLHIYVGRDSRMMNLFNRAAPRRSTHLIYRQMRDLLP